VAVFWFVEVSSLWFAYALPNRGATELGVRQAYFEGSKKCLSRTRCGAPLLETVGVV